MRFSSKNKKSMRGGANKFGAPPPKIGAPPPKIGAPAPAPAPPPPPPQLPKFELTNNKARGNLMSAISSGEVPKLRKVVVGNQPNLVKAPKPLIAKSFVKSSLQIKPVQGTATVPTTATVQGIKPPPIKPNSNPNVNQKPPDFKNLRAMMDTKLVFATPKASETATQLAQVIKQPQQQQQQQTPETVQATVQTTVPQKQGKPPPQVPPKPGTATATVPVPGTAETNVSELSFAERKKLLANQILGKTASKVKDKNESGALNASNRLSMMDKILKDENIKSINPNDFDKLYIKASENPDFLKKTTSEQVREIKDIYKRNIIEKMKKSELYNDDLELDFDKFYNYAKTNPEFFEGTDEIKAERILTLYKNSLKTPELKNKINLTEVQPSQKPQPHKIKLNDNTITKLTEQIKTEYPNLDLEKRKEILILKSKELEELEALEALKSNPNATEEEIKEMENTIEKNNIKRIIEYQKRVDNETMDNSEFDRLYSISLRKDNKFSGKTELEKANLIKQMYYNPSDANRVLINTEYKKEARIAKMKEVRKQMMNEARKKAEEAKTKEAIMNHKTLEILKSSKLGKPVIEGNKILIEKAYENLIKNLNSGVSYKSLLDFRKDVQNEVTRLTKLEELGKGLIKDVGPNKNKTVPLLNIKNFPPSSNYSKISFNEIPDPNLQPDPNLPIDRRPPIKPIPPLKPPGLSPILNIASGSSIINSETDFNEPLDPNQPLYGPQIKPIPPPKPKGLLHIKESQESLSDPLNQSQVLKLGETNDIRESSTDTVQTAPYQTEKKSTSKTESQSELLVKKLEAQKSKLKPTSPNSLKPTSPNSQNLKLQKSQIVKLLQSEMIANARKQFKLNTILSKNDGYGSEFETNNKKDIMQKHQKKEPPGNNNTLPNPITTNNKQMPNPPRKNTSFEELLKSRIGERRQLLLKTRSEFEKEKKNANKKSKEEDEEEEKVKEKEDWNGGNRNLTKKQRKTQKQFQNKNKTPNNKSKKNNKSQKKNKSKKTLKH